MAESRDRYEYGYAYWFQFMHGQDRVEYVYFQLLTTEDGDDVRRNERGLRLAFANELGRDGWLIWQEWVGVSVGPADPLLDAIYERFPDQRPKIPKVSIARLRRRI